MSVSVLTFLLNEELNLPARCGRAACIVGDQGSLGMAVELRIYSVNDVMRGDSL